MAYRFGMTDGRCFTIATSDRLLNDYIMKNNGIQYQDNYAYRRFLQAQGPDVLARPTSCVLIRANDTEDQEGGTARPAKPLLPVALVERVGCGLKAFLEAIDLLKHRLAGRAPKDPLVDQET